MPDFSLDLGCCWNFKKKSFSSDLVRSDFIWKDSCNFISSFVGILLSLLIMNVLISKQRKNTHTHTHIYIQEFHVYLQLYCWYLVVFPGLKGSPKPSSTESSDLVKTLNVPTKARSSRFRNRRMLDPSKFVLPPLPHHLIVLHKRKHPGALLLLLLLCLLLPLVTPPPCRASIHTKLLVDFVKSWEPDQKGAIRMRSQ